MSKVRRPQADELKKFELEMAAGVRERYVKGYEYPVGCAYFQFRFGC